MLRIRTFLVSIFFFSYEEAKHEKNYRGNWTRRRIFERIFDIFLGIERKNLNNGGDVDVALYLTIKISRDIFCCGENFWKKRLSFSFFSFFCNDGSRKGKIFQRTVGSKNIHSLGCFIIIVIKFFIKYIFVYFVVLF